MRHLDPDRMVRLARGESSADDVESSHLVDCATCHNELDAMRHIAELGTATRDLRGLPPRPDPGGRSSRLPEPDGSSPGPPERGGPLPRRPRPGDGRDDKGLAPAGPPPERRTPRSASRSPGLPAWVRPLGRPAWVRPRRLPAWVRPPLIAAVAALLAMGGTLLVTRLSDRPPQSRVMARAELSPPPAAPGDATGAARVLTAVGQPATLDLQVGGLPPPTGYYQVWLIDPTTRARFPLGALGATRHASLPLPGTVDLTAFREVDVSAEDYDSNAAHSGTTVLRGTLTG